MIELNMNLNDLSLAELRALAAENGLTSYSALRKAQLIEKLEALKPVEKPEEKAVERPVEAPVRKEMSRETAARERNRETSPRENSYRDVSTQRDSSRDVSAQRDSSRDTLRITRVRPANPEEPSGPQRSMQELDSGEEAEGILEVLAEGYGFIRSGGYLSGDDDVYVAPSQIKRFNLKTGDWVNGNRRVKAPGEKFSAVLYINSVNGVPAAKRGRLVPFENLTPIFPKERIHLERKNGELSLRIVDLLSPVGKGQRGMIVAQPKVGKTTLLKQIAHAIQENHPELFIIILLIDERPEEVTDIRESVAGDNVEVVYSTFDELPEHHKKVSEMVIERAKRLVENGMDIVILLDSITRLTRAYNVTVTPSGRTLSGGLDPAALYMPKRFFGAARCMREGGSLTILTTALIETGSRLDDMVFEEFKGTGNMELVLNRKLSERRIFPAIDILKSSTRNDSLLLTEEEQEASALIRKVTVSGKSEEATEQVLNLFASTKTNDEFIKKLRYIVF